MKRLTLIVVLTCCLMAGCGRRVTGEEKQAAIDLFEANSQKEFVGTQAPDFSLPDLQGNIVSLSQIAPGKHIVLDFFKPPVRGLFCAREFSAQ